MFLPIGDAPNPREIPWVTYTLIALNVVVFLGLWPTSARRPRPNDPRALRYLQTIERTHGADYALQAASQLTVYDLIVFEHGFKPRDPELADLFSSMFLHGGLAHLLGNMLFLWIFGNNVEARAGPGVFLLGYLLTGVVAAAGDALLRMGSPLPAVGASGAISGVLGAYYLLFPGNVVRVAVLLFLFVLDVWELRARIVLGFFVLVQNLLPALITAAEGGVSATPVTAQAARTNASRPLAAQVRQWRAPDFIKEPGWSSRWFAWLRDRHVPGWRPPAHSADSPRSLPCPLAPRRKDLLPWQSSHHDGQRR